MESVRVGVWGVGVWGEKHARVYESLPGATLIGVHDRNPSRAAEVAARHRCRAFETPEALLAARPFVDAPKFIEAHRLAVFQPRSLDIDVVFDLMIHDIDAVLHLTGQKPVQLSAVGVAVLSSNEDIANARLEFADGCVANLTASRVSQERLRRIRFFQDTGYLSIDLYEKRCELLSLDRALLKVPRVHPLQLAAAIR